MALTVFLALPGSIVLERFYAVILSWVVWFEFSSVFQAGYFILASTLSILWCESCLNWLNDF